MDSVENSPALRPLPDVVAAVLNIIPNTVQEKAIISTKLNIIVENYKASSLSDLSDIYQSVQKVLTDNLVLTNDQWYDDLIKVYTGQLDYNDYLQF